MSEDIELWKRIQAAFEAHCGPGDRHAQDALERVAAKCLHSPQRQALNASNCDVWEENLSSESLAELQVYHSRALPLRSNGPIVVLLYQGHRVVIDGNNRVNAWRVQQAPGPFDAIMIEPRAE